MPWDTHINEAIESRRKISSRITFAPHDCLKQIGRPIGGEHYRRLADAIRRLAGTLVITNIREADQPEIGGERGFHWLTGYWIPKRYRRYRTAPSGVTYITPRDPEGEADPARPWEIELHPCSWRKVAISSPVATSLSRRKSIPGNGNKIGNAGMD